MHQRNERSFIIRMNVHFDRYTQLNRRRHAEKSSYLL